MDKAPNGVIAKGSTLKNSFVVMVYLDNSKGQNDLITNQLPTLEKIVKAVQGQEVQTDTPGQFRFSFEGERLASITPVRLAYEQRYSIISHL